MPVSLSVDVRDTASAKLRELMLRTMNIDDALEDIGSMLESSTQQRFEAEQTPEGDDWQEHADATKAARGDNASILRDEIDLYDSITHEVQGNDVAVGTNRIYGRIQQLGGQAGRGLAVTIPARPYLGLSDDDEREINHIIEGHLNGT